MIYSISEYSIILIVFIGSDNKIISLSLIWNDNLEDSAFPDQQ